MSFTDIGKAGSQVFGGRFNIVNVLPGLSLAIFVAVLIRSGLYGDGPPQLNRILPDPLLSAETFLILVGILVLGLLSRPFQVQAVQFLEGYWRSGRMRALFAELHLRRKRTAEVLSRAADNPLPDPELHLADAVRRARIAARRAAVAERGDDIVAGYPDNDDDVMPTRLGNLLKRAEKNAGSRYGIDADVMYPRLYYVLPETLRRAIGQELDQLDAAAGLCLALIAATGFSLPLVYRLDLWSLLPFLTALLALLAYRGALRTAEHHARQLAVAFDLHRFDLLKALHLPLPRDEKQEFELNQLLSDLYDRQSTFNEDYDGPAYAHPDQRPARRLLAGLWRRLRNRGR